MARLNEKVIFQEFILALEKNTPLPFTPSQLGETQYFRDMYFQLQKRLKSRKSHQASSSIIKYHQVVLIKCAVLIKCHEAS